MSETFLIWGAGGHGKVVLDAIVAAGGSVVGFIDREAGARDSFAALPVLPESALDGPQLPIGASAIAIAIGDNGARLRAFGRVAGRFPCPPVLHPGAVIGQRVTVGHGTVVLPRAVLNADSRVGRAVIVNTGAIVEHDCSVEDGVHLSPGAILCGAVRIGTGSWVGAGAVVIPGVRVGEEAVIGAGSVVLGDVERGRRVAGNPARPLKAAGE